MYLTAHRVRSQDGEEGINAFLYLHHRVWETPPNETDDPGVLVKKSISLSPPSGNLVRSYLDLIAPDSTPWTEIHKTFMTFLASKQAQPLPWIGLVDKYKFRLGMEIGLLPHWRGELASLYEAAKDLYLVR